MAKKNYEDLAKKVLELVGGEENVTFFTHCMTRLRFNVKDKGLVDVDALDNVDGFAGALWAGDQLQIIVGTAVNSVYDSIIKISNLKSNEGVEEQLDEVKEPFSLKKLPKNIIDSLAGCMTQLVPYLIVIGMFSAVYSLIGPSGFSLVGEKNNVYQLFYWVAQAGFYFMPIAVAYAASKKFGCNQLMALFLAAVLLYPDLMTVIQAGKFTCWRIPVSKFTFSNQVLPMILACWTMAYVEKLVNKFMPEVLKTVLSHTVVMIIMLPITMCLFAPLGTWLGDILSIVFNGLYNLNAPIALAVFGFIYVVTIIPGMHQVVALGAFMDFMAKGVNYSLFPVTFIIAFFTTVANIAIVIRTKDTKLKEIATAGAISSIIGGVTEPTIYTILLKYKKVMLAVMTGMGVSGFLMGIFHVGVYAFSSSNFLAILGFVAGGTSNLIHALISLIVGLVITFIMVLVFGYDSSVRE